MRKTATILTIFAFVILGIWFLQNGFAQAAQATPLTPNTQTAIDIWQTEMVDDSTGIGYRSSLGIDSNDNLHISYDFWPNGTSQYLRYARWNGSTWITETIERIGGSSQINATSLALDKNDRSHISYDYDFGTDTLKYAYWGGAAWQIETVDSAESTGRDNSLVLDSNDNPHISYIGVGATYALKYAYWDGANWQIETVDSAADKISLTSIAIDSNDNPHIVYHQWDSNNSMLMLKYAYWDGMTWTIETVSSANGSTGGNPSLALDSQDRPHITYNASGLEYAYWDGNQWQKETVDTQDSVGFPSIALDNNDNVYISYSETITGSLKFAFQDEIDWQIDIVDPDPASGYWYTSVQLDSLERPIFSYTCLGCGSKHGLRIARWQGGTDSKVYLPTVIKP